MEHMLHIIYFARVQVFISCDPLFESIASIIILFCDASINVHLVYINRLFMMNYFMSVYQTFQDVTISQCRALETLRIWNLQLISHNDVILTTMGPRPMWFCSWVLPKRPPT